MIARMAPSSVHLGLDTATPFLSIALWAPGRGVLGEVRERVDREHGTRLLPELEALLRRAGVDRAELGGVGVGVGPGSYTGVRIGVATALGLARGLGVPVGGGDTLAAIAARGLADGESGLAALDARRGNLYLGHYRREGSRLLTLAPPRLVARAEVARLYPAARLLEDLAPDAAFLARQALAGAPAAPVYL